LLASLRLTALAPYNVTWALRSEGLVFLPVCGRFGWIPIPLIDRGIVSGRGIFLAARPLRKQISLMMFIAEFLNVDLVEEIRTNSSTGIGSQATHQPASQLSLFSQSFSPTS